MSAETSGGNQLVKTINFGHQQNIAKTLGSKGMMQRMGTACRDARLDKVSRILLCSADLDCLPGLGCEWVDLGSPTDAPLRLYCIWLQKEQTKAENDTDK